MTIRSTAVMVAAVSLALSGCSAPAGPPRGTTNDMSAEPSSTPVNFTFPTIELAEDPYADPEKFDGPARPIRFDNGTRVSVRGWKINGKFGLSSGLCGVRIGQQRLATVGGGKTDAYTCKRLVDAGPLPSAGTTRRIGLIYNVSGPSPPMPTYQTAVILLGDGAGWRVDVDRLGTYDGTPAAKSISALAKAVR